MLSGSSALRWSSTVNRPKVPLRNSGAQERRPGRSSHIFTSSAYQAPHSPPIARHKCASLNGSLVCACVAEPGEAGLWLKINALTPMDALRSMDAPVNTAVQQSIDEADDVGWVPGEVFEVSSVKQVTDLAMSHSSQKIILMCKSKACRPCKAFSLTYKRFAGKFEDIVFLSVIGEQSAELRDMMIALNIRQTPTFLCFYDRGIVHRHKGNNKERMEELLSSDWQSLKDLIEKRDPGDAFLGLS